MAKNEINDDFSFDDLEALGIDFSLQDDLLDDILAEEPAPVSRRAAREAREAQEAAKAKEQAAAKPVVHRVPAAKADEEPPVVRRSSSKAAPAAEKAEGARVPEKKAAVKSTSRPTAEKGAAKPTAKAAPVKGSARSATAKLAEEKAQSRKAAVRSHEEEPVQAPPKKKKKDHFKKRFSIYLLILAIIFVVALIVLWVALSNYQSKVDAETAEAERIAAEAAEEAAHKEAVYRAPQLAFESWYEQADADYWTDLWFTQNPQDISGRDFVRSFMEENFDHNTIEPFKAMEYTAEAPVYVLRQGEKALAHIHLTGSDVNWNVSNVEMDVKGEESASVRVAVGSKVYCNGVELGSEFAGAEESNFSYEPLKDKLVNPVSWTTYSIDGLLSKPELSVTPPAGCSVTETAQGDFLLCLNDSEESEAYKTKAVNFVKAYLYYYMSGYNGTWGNLYNALAYLVNGTDAYQELFETYDGVCWNTAYGNIDTSKTEASGVVIWADNCYSVDVTYNADCTLNGEPIDYADATMRIYFTNTDGSFIITNFETL